MPIIIGLVIAMMIVSVIIAFIEKSNIEKSNYSYKTTQTRVQEKSFSSPVISVSAKQILSDFNSNEVRAGDQYNGKRVRISGCAASIDNMMGILSVYINSCGGDFDIDYVRAQFPNRAKEKLSRLNKGQKVVVECTIDDGGDIMGVAASNCILK
ncbi:OB-fold putative lipoprotein [Fibrobacter sp. UWP2]|uniref:OB-fold putative lipoprotein n=1 Tax=Fibrobacter sp. UWP2 TaxID=1896216 RepID=UPI002101BE76|nr:OB-fold putative lipoprotein [Fibrobacter sp. UWP2]